MSRKSDVPGIVDDVFLFAHVTPRRAFRVYDDSSTIVDCSKEPSLTVQSEAEKCDINYIVARAIAGEFVDHMASRPGEFGVDVSMVQDYKSALDFVQEADRQFMELPAGIRNRFDNDPGKFLQFLDDPKNVEEGRKLGIYKPLPAGSAVVPAEQAEGRRPAAEAPEGASQGSGAKPPSATK